VTQLRNYQRDAVAAVRAEWNTGTRAVLLVAPTGAGKTVLGEELSSDCGPVLWVAHRRELVTQTVRRLAQRFGSRNVGAIMTGEPLAQRARMQVGTVQTLLARGSFPEAERLVLDEAHHYPATEWSAVAERYKKAQILGLTATPQRDDGTPLGDVFDGMVVAANYSELVRDGHLVPARVLQPARHLGNDIAQDPLTAWAEHSEGAQTFVFCARVAIAHELAQRFRDAGVIAETVEADTPKRERDRIIERFRAGRVKVLTNVFALTEGIDIPEARCVMLMRSFAFVGAYLQAVGRVLRPAKGKPDAIVIDLVGGTLKHGLPTRDRAYSLDGRPISGEGERPEGERSEFEQRVVGVPLRVAAEGSHVERAAPVALALEQEHRVEFEAAARAAPASFARMRRVELFGRST